jgi:hypothetical protein
MRWAATIWYRTDHTGSVLLANPRLAIALDDFLCPVQYGETKRARLHEALPDLGWPDNVYRQANSIAREFTRPFVVSRATVAGQCQAGMGTYIILNDEGYLP